MLKPLDWFMAHFRLSDDGHIELAEFGEDTESRIWDECYPMECPSALRYSWEGPA